MGNNNPHTRPGPKSPKGPLVFLDIDGVLTRKPDYGKIDTQLLVEFLRWIDTIGGVIVLISSWNEEQFSETLRRLPRRLADRVTSQVSINFGNRNDAILHWIAENACEHDGVVILDDEDEKYANTPLARLVVSPQTENGMSASDYIRATDIIHNKKFTQKCNP